jgi:hypothetical protein
MMIVVRADIQIFALTETFCAPKEIWNQGAEVFCALTKAGNGLVIPPIQLLCLCDAEVLNELQEHIVGTPLHLHERLTERATLLTAYGACG